MAGFRLLLLLLACTAEVAMANLYDGLPRPPGFPRVPTTEYGPKPPCYLNGTVVKCEWYGFAHIDYLVKSVECLAVTRAVLANTTRTPPGSIEPYSYYTFDIYVDPVTNSPYCLYGCFDMSAAGTPPGMAPPPATVATPPPATVATPPPATVATPPPASIPAPPAPSVLVPPPPGVAPPPTLSGSPPGALAPTMTTPPPPPGGTRVVSLSGAGFLQPRGIVPFVISGALLVHGLLGF